MMKAIKTYMEQQFELGRFAHITIRSEGGACLVYDGDWNILASCATVFEAEKAKNKALASVLKAIA